jgi:hypothetical protein
LNINVINIDTVEIYDVRLNLCDGEIFYAYNEYYEVLSMTMDSSIIAPYSTARFTNKIDAYLEFAAVTITNYGPIYIYNNGTSLDVSISNSKFANSTFAYYGAFVAIYNYNSLLENTTSLTLLNCEFSNGYSLYGGSVYTLNIFDIIINYSYIHDNNAYYGGAYLSEFMPYTGGSGTGKFTLTNSVFAGNFALQ